MNDSWCVECGDEFHEDDTGGYNPECPCCGLCRECCPKNPNSKHYDPDDDYEDEAGARSLGSSEETP